jgi:prepilin-type N-terminal cleavage/methylation domain-containing protein
MARRAAQAGLTLVELMVAMAILGIAIAAAMSVGFTMINGYRDSRRSSAVERSARGAVQFLAAAIRSASPGVENGDIADFVGCNTWQGLDVVNAGGAPDELRVVYGSGAVVTSLRTTFDQDSTWIHAIDGASFQAGDHALVIDPGNSGVLVAIESTKDLGDGTWELKLAEAPRQTCTSTAAPHEDFSFAPTSLVVRAKLAHFYVDSSGGLPTLMMDPDGAGAEVAEPIAEGIEDLQIAFAADTTGDGVTPEVGAATNDDEWYYNFPGDNGAPLVTATPWRAVRITVTARSLVELSGANDSIRPAAEDRAAQTGPDGYRRRTLSTTAEIRNLRGSP